MKVARALGWLIAGATLLASGVYFFRYLYYWEWHRALITGIILVAAEVALAGGLILRKIGRLQRETEQARSSAADPAVLARIRQAAPERDHFAWLSPRNGNVSVFITVLLGGGVIVSAVAWAVEKIAGSTTTPALEEGLASRLSTIGFPDGGLVPDEDELLATEGPYRSDEELRLLLGPVGKAR